MNKFKEYRMLRNYTIEQMAEESKIPLNRLRDIEEQIIEPDLADLCLMKEIFGVSADYLIGEFPDDPPIKSLQDLEIMTQILALPQEEMMKLLGDLCKHLSETYSDQEIQDMLLQLENEGKL